MADELKILRKQQASARGAITRMCNNIKSELEKATVVCGQNLADYTAQLDAREVKLVELDEKVIRLLTTDDEVDDELRQSEEYTEKLVLWRARATRWITNPKNIPGASGSTTGSTGSVNSAGTQGTSGGATGGTTSGNRTIRLPKLEIKKFDGSFSQWLTFWGQFEGAIHQQDIPKTDKFQYLKSYLIGAAAKAIENLSLNEDNYDTAISIITSRFGRKDLLISAHLNNCLKLTPVHKASDIGALRQLYDTCQMEMRSLESLEYSKEKYGEMLAHIIAGLMPLDLLHDYGREKTEDELYQIDELMEFLNREVQCRERASVVHRASREQLQQPKIVSNNSEKSQGFTRNNPGYKTGFQRSYPSAATLNTAVTNSNVRACVFCNSPDHPFYQCNEITIGERRGIVAQRRLCFLCLRSGHPAHACQGKIQKCRNCGRQHHQALCDLRVGRYQTEPKIPTGNLSQNNSSNPTNTAFSNSASTNNTPRPNTVALASVVNELETGVVLLQTVPADITDELGTKTRVRCVLDGASHRSFIKEKLSRDLNLEVIGTEGLDIFPFSHTKPIHVERRKVKVVLGNVRTGEKVEIIALETPEICGARFSIPGDEVRREMENRNLDLADKAEYQNGESATQLDILIGANFFWKVATVELERLGNRLMALNTTLGWTVMGALEASESVGSQVGVNTVAVMHVAISPQEDLLSAQVEKFWNLESLGITDGADTRAQEREESLREFENNISFKHGRYEVALPWKANRDQLGNNFNQTKKRVLSLIGKLRERPNEFKAYDEIIKEQLSSGIIERVEEKIDQCPEPGTLYYIPHHGVCREDSLTTKLRIVNDASAHEPNSPSLNDCLEPGPNLTPELFKILVSFRKNRVAFTGDVEKAFHQIGIREEDRDVLRFLWVEEFTGTDSPKLVTFRFTRVPFGCTSSPYLLAATIKHHARKYEKKYPKAAKALENNLYVDDMLGGDTSPKAANKVIEEATEVLNQAGMRLRKWRSNSREIRERWSERSNDQEGNVVFPTPAPLKVLGLTWDEVNDVFTFDVTGLLKFLASRKNTKRWVLKSVARIFDPLGIVSPFTVRAKMLLQELWERKLPWDKELTDPELSLKFNDWCAELPNLQKIEIPRFYFANEPQNLEPKVELHGFTDASKRAYAVVVYLRSEYPNGQVTTALVASKTRVAPLNELSLPRLELMGALLGARLITNLRETLEYSASTVHLWTDAKIILHWIRGSAAKWKPFVSNRVKEIQKLVNPDCWQHVAGRENPADLPSRGKTLLELKESELWWHGPPWLQNPDYPRPCDLEELEIHAEDLEGELKSKQEYAAMVMGTGDNLMKPLLDLQKYSSLNLALRITAWVKRYANNSKKKEKLVGPLTAEEIIRAEICVVGMAQRESYPEELYCLENGLGFPKHSSLYSLHPHLDKNGLICVGGRIDAANISYRERHPWIVSAKHRFTELLIDSNHIRLKHAGVNETLTELREQYWIPKVRPVVKRRIHNCPRCKRFSAKPSAAVMAPLPEARINPSPPFAVCGVDFAGPMYTKQGAKCYIALYTCAVTRAVHLELVSDLSTDKFLLSFRRFIARRGIVSIIYSDNAKTFKRAEADLTTLLDNLRHPEVAKFFCSLRIKWRYIVDRAAHHGGYWERMVRVVKAALKKTLGQARLTYEELETMLIEVEAMVNSRPISFVYQEAGEPAPLTPAHFLVGQRLTALPSRVYSTNETIASHRVELTKRLKYRQTLLDQFWVRWKTDYLLELRSAHHRPNCTPTKELKEGDVVLIGENLRPRLMWKIAVVQEIMRGRDGIVRSCMLRLPDGTNLRRPIQLLYNLEL